MRVNIYIRKDNEELWNAIADKSAWVNDRLWKGVDSVYSSGLDVKPPKVKYDKPKNLATEVIAHREEQLIEQASAAFEGKTCKNGHRIPSGRDRCLSKGCKYA